MNRRWPLIVLIAVSCLCAQPACADTIYLKNGRKVKGIIKSRDAKKVVLEVAGGEVDFKPLEIKNIEFTDATSREAMRWAWEKDKESAKEKIAQQKIIDANKPKEIHLSGPIENIILPVVLNKKIPARLILDTGAATVTLKKNMAQALGVDLTKVSSDTQLILADGKFADALRVTLDSVSVQGAEARGVEAVILMGDQGPDESVDGLLGMSYLKKFNFKIDSRNKKLILEK